MIEGTGFGEILQVFKKKIGWIIGCIVLFVFASVFITKYFITPKYTATSQLVPNIVTSNNSNNNVNDANFNLTMITTYKDLIKTTVILDRVQEELAKEGRNATIDELKAMLTVTLSTNSQVFSISATSTRPALSQSVANITALQFQEQTEKIYGEAGKVSIVTEAVEPSAPSSPNLKLNMVIGFMLGLVIGTSLVFLTTYLDTTLKNDVFITDTLRINRLGIVSNITSKETSKISGGSSKTTKNKSKRRSGKRKEVIDEFDDDEFSSFEDEDELW